MEFPIKIVHRDDDAARAAFDHFPPLDNSIVEGYSRKRFGSAQMLVLHLPNRDFLAWFKQRCLEEPTVEEVFEITFSEFSEAPSNSI